MKLNYIIRIENHLTRNIIKQVIETMLQAGHSLDEIVEHLKEQEMEMDRKYRYSPKAKTTELFFSCIRERLRSKDMKVRDCFKASFVLGVKSGRLPTLVQRKRNCNNIPAWVTGSAPTKKKKRRRR